LQKLLRNGAHGHKGVTPGYKEMSSIFADQWRSRIGVPMRGDEGGAGLQGSQSMSTAVHIT